MEVETARGFDVVWLIRMKLLAEGIRLLVVFILWVVHG
jgi:hypothetical protein